MSAIKAIKAFFEDVTMEELKALTIDERAELGKLCCVELNVEFVPNTSQ